MSKLNSITLSNMRKFGPEVNIELAPGATILLAPNGTGKTTVFEAIEFGLTGKIARLSDDLSPVIRDDEVAASVSLNFTDFTITSLITSTGKVHQDGDLNAIFPGISENDIPFLLRLTHLLDQRENEWIVKAEEKDAGSQLARLPISRDGSRASTVLSAVRRSLNEKKSSEESLLLSHEANLDNWNQLLHERDIAAAGATDVLRPLNQIAKVISSAAAKAQSLDQIPPSLLTEPVSQDALSVAIASLSEILKTKIDRTRSQISDLSEANNLVDTFGTTKITLEKLSAELASTKINLNLHASKRAESTAILQKHQTDIHLAQQQHIKVVQDLERLIGENTTRKQIEHHSAALVGATVAVQKAEENCRVLREQYEHLQQIKSHHFQLEAQIQTLAKSEQTLRTSLALVSEWKTTEEQIKSITLEIDSHQHVLEHLSKEMQEKLSTRDTCKIAEATARSHFQVLSSSTDAIRQAVASIAEHLSPNEGNCPVCLEPHGAAVLQIRVAQALQAIDPNLTLAEQQLRIATEALKASDAEFSSVEEAIKSTQKLIESLKTNRQILEQQVSKFLNTPFIVGESALQASESLKQQLESNLSTKQTLVTQQSALEPPIVSDVFEQGQHAYNNAVKNLDQARLHQSEVEARLDQAVATLTALTSSSPVAQTLEHLTTEKSKIELRINDLNGKAQTIRSELSTQQDQQQEFVSTIQRIEDEIGKAQSQIILLRSKWQRIELPGDPIADVAKARATELSSIMANLENSASVLENIGVEISAWAKLNESHSAQRLIDNQRQEYSEEEYTAQLNKNLNSARNNLLRLSQLSEAMNTLDSALKREIGNIQKHVSKVVPRWQALLKRVVRESRFHQASLKFFSSYNKERAGVSVPLGGKSVAVPNVASEAQLTDLQLTFLLSMAMSHQWSPWKALLLDDPTQHHDLVHASAVFDLLRDYIVDHGFQVVIATHDALQARYFMRKLQNDGIDARLWTLVPTANGVTAEEGHWKQSSN